MHYQLIAHDTKENLLADRFVIAHSAELAQPCMRTIWGAARTVALSAWIADRWWHTVFTDGCCWSSTLLFFRQNENKFVFYCHFAPFVMVLAFGVSAAVIMMINERRIYIADLFHLFMIGGLYSLLVGYFYVLLAVIIFKLLKSIKLIYVEPHRAFYE
ncbi:hypothetical protein ACO0LG_24450 [Undibacterium sp. Ji42W]|uniref:hypothetical protein n=1 Tax=Undibacterium sp. Ji42W TaxID=3413039 RepID=UPI003BF04B52